MVIAVDFDGTLSYGEWPHAGKPNTRLIEWLKERKAKGDNLILWTCRQGEPLDIAVKWCAEQGLEFDAVNENLPAMIALYGSDTRKIAADWYIDDTHFTAEYLMKKVEKMEEPRVKRARIGK